MTADQLRRKPKRLSPRKRPSHARLMMSSIFSKIGAAIFVILVFAFGGSVLLFTSGVLRIGPRGDRPVAEQDSMLSSGSCAVNASGTVVGRVIGSLTPGRGMPRRRFQIEAIKTREVLQVFADEVQVVPCSPSLKRE